MVNLVTNGDTLSLDSTPKFYMFKKSNKKAKAMKGEPLHKAIRLTKAADEFRNMRITITDNKNRALVNSLWAGDGEMVQTKLKNSLSNSINQSPNNKFKIGQNLNLINLNQTVLPRKSPTRSPPHRNAKKGP